MPNLITNDGTDDIPEVLGGFWSKIPRDTGNDKRSADDQARMQLLQQLLAAILNQEAFGTDYSDGSGGNFVTDAIAGFDTLPKATILQWAVDIASINENGSLEPLPAAFD